MENNNLPEVFKAPKLEEIVDNNAVAFKNDLFKTYLNKTPPKKWLKGHPTATKKIVDANGTKREVAAEFLPIDKHELLLDTIFQQWKIEVLREGTMFHSIYCTVRVHYLHPVTKEWLFHDGVGAVKAQSDSGKPFSQDTIKAVAVQIGLPAAKSYAIKDACEHLGKLFGRDVNRADTMAFESMSEKSLKTKADERVEAMIENAKTLDALKKIQPHLKNADQRALYDDKFKELNKK